MGLHEIGNLVIEKITDEWTLAGHNLTGGFIESLEVFIKETQDSLNIEIWGNEYGIYVSTGVEAQNIPYTRRRRGQGQGGTSKYITGLINYVQTRMGVGDHREATSIAFAIANTHSVHGMLGSGFLDEVSEKHQESIDNAVTAYLDERVEKNM